MLSQTTGYAVSALSFLATNGSRPVLVREIAEALALPPPYLAKIVNSLGRRGLVATQRGIGGGCTSRGRRRRSPSGISAPPSTTP
ncbi:MAG: Rrf2 family transcriptional regulator [Thermoanaerobaculia bacterium]|nr:Rrf2 family transcriptional regulator [Thermoanaerobaculia bacterium]